MRRRMRGKRVHDTGSRSAPRGEGKVVEAHSARTVAQLGAAKANLVKARGKRDETERQVGRAIRA